MIRWVTCLILVLASSSAACAAGRPITIDDLLAVKNVSDPQVSPDGRWVVYVLSALDRGAAKAESDLYLVPLAGGAAKQLTTHKGSDTQPRWRPDGKAIVFVSDRSGSPQLWSLPFEGEGGEATQLTRLPIDVSGPVWSPKGDLVACTASVYPGKNPDETAAIDKEKSAAKSKARSFDHLMIRHWNSWDDGKRSHVFVIDAATGKARDLIPDWPVNVPPAPFGGSEDYAVSPDGKEIAFRSEPLADEALSTNSDIWTLPTSGSGKAVNLTEASKGADAQPSYSPDGSLIAYVSQARTGFEADLWVLKARHRATGQTLDVSSKLDRPVQSYTWGNSLGRNAGEPGGGWSIYAVIDDQGTEPVVSFQIASARDGGLEIKKGTTAGRLVVKGAANGAIQAVPGGLYLVLTRSSSNRPGELFRARIDVDELTPLSSANASLASELDLPAPEFFNFEGSGGAKVGGLLIKPPGFDPKRKYPVMFLIHGGPQGAWHDEWHARWNYAMFVSPGYVGVAINPRGSTGYGQLFTDQISRDWTGRVYEDLINGLDFALKTYPFLDSERIAAAGGSYGGFMVNWIAGHADRFKALISHAGVFDLHSMYFSTEELWFNEWEFAGPPWKSPAIYRDQSPSHFVTGFKTPTLVLHGALDFRVPDVQGISMFTALQRQGVPSRLVYFPDEGHWIAKPANRIVWWREVHQWLNKYLAESANAKK